jgi:hypothetical protein
MIFNGCDCIDERRRKPLYHDPCEKVTHALLLFSLSPTRPQPAVVIVKTIYTDEEAQRREEEEDLFQHKFEEIESEV